MWGLALCLVETLAARPIIDGDSATMMGITLDLARRPTPRNEGVDVPDAVEAVFERALALDPRARQRDVGIFWNELTAALQVREGERRVPRDERSEDGGAPRIELMEMPSRAPPSATPVLSARSAAAERALAMDLEFDPLSAPGSKQPVQPVIEPPRVTAPAASGSHFVPDLELEPAPPSRRVSGARRIELPAEVQSNVLDLDEAPQQSASLDLDLSPDEPLARRAASAPRMAAVQVPAQRPSTPPPRSLSGSFSAVRDSVPPVSAAAASGRSTALELDARANSVAGGRAGVRPSVPPVPASGGSIDAAFVTKLELSVPEERSLMRRLRVPLGLLGAAILVALFDPIYAAVSGEVLELIGLRLSVFAGVLLLLALGLGVREAIRDT